MNEFNYLHLVFCLFLMSIFVLIVNAFETNIDVCVILICIPDKYLKSFDFFAF